MLNKPEFQMAFPAVTREYTPGACRNSGKLMRFRPRCKMRPDSPAFHAEEFHVPIKDVSNIDFPDGTEQNPQEHCHNNRRTLMSPQECKIDWCTPKSTQHEAHFPFIESIDISHYTSYTTSGLTSFTTIQRFPETPISGLQEHQFQ